MGSAKRMSRLGMLAVGLGIGAALAATPGTASATTDIDISFDGMDIFNGGGTATATSGMGDLAIAIGPNSGAIAEGGFGDFASAFSTGPGGAGAFAGGAVSGAANNFDSASATGNGVLALAGNPLGALPDTTPSSFDVASAFGGDGAPLSAIADAGENGSGDYATAVGDHVSAVAGTSVDPATPANFDWASVWGNLLAPTTNLTVAGAGAVGLGLSGSNDLAFTFDPFGTIGSEALAGGGGNFDLAGAWGDDLTAMSTLVDLLFHIAPLF